MSTNTEKPCTCRADIEKTLTERFAAQAQEASGHKVSLTGYALIFTEDGHLIAKGCMPMELTATFPLKKGGTKVKTQKQSMIFNFCPFCGQKYEDKAGAS